MKYFLRFAPVVAILITSVSVFAQTGNLENFTAQAALVSEFEVNGL
ncbi:MAG TPA: hypothetical protein VK612_12705 [Pyrinomonadaceae bacterium]|nr:hypothetical protein [Pyrinomonadaceae bacterium]